MEDYIDTTESTDTETPSLGKELATSFALSAAATAGMLTAFIAIPAAVEKVRVVRENRKAKKEAKKASREEK
jgi:hypothetical protein